ncbi:hypothetical protein HW561_14655 [Rhodobacteraceae bacterium B1Z28]|uniref:Antibiotic biosynthesis monooxygenase n=1 Tax=Ruegeria haliotis TaxID=2747601 RepID=A0ABX2PSM9_9RHOB|nr:hypothetical protein [Ruegeria haliotis]NVO57033.1 hypothetical protein [Ruegeria haliotis]
MMKLATGLKTAALAATLAIGTMGPAMAADLSKAGTIEYVTFKAKDGVTVEAMSEAAAGGTVNANLTENYAGFVDRHVALQADGVWIEVVYWESEEVGRAALEKFVADPVNKAFLDLVDVDSVTITYSDMH